MTLDHAELKLYFIGTHTHAVKFRLFFCLRREIEDIRFIRIWFLMDLRIHNTNENDSHMKYIEMVRTLFTYRAKHTKAHDWIERQIHKLDKMDSIENIYK